MIIGTDRFASIITTPLIEPYVTAINMSHTTVGDQQARLL